MDRRRFLLLLAAGLTGAAVGHGTVGLVNSSAPPRLAPAGEAVPVPRGVPGLVPVEPPTGVVNALPGEGTSIALSIDDGTSTAVVAAFVAFAVDANVRLTFFPNGRYPSWEENAAELRPLVDSGQVTLGNHTWSHPDVTTLSDEEVADEIGRNRDFLWRVFGVRDSPFFRPPYGARDARTDRIAADLGHPTIALWNGTLGDARVISPDELMAAARTSFAAQSIILGHANHPTVTTVYGDLLELLRERGLRTVTLADVWATPSTRLRGSTARGTVRTG
jgi:peptidoglycan/xylan/chitin deacetylase (PgdA/CDA1 family)